MHAAYGSLEHRGYAEAKIAQMGSDESIEGISLLRMFPSLLLIVCILLFAVPLYSILHIVTNPVLVYWFGQTPCYVLLCLPLLILAIFILHARRAQTLASTSVPCRPAVIAVIILPSIALLVISNITFHMGLNFKDMLLSTDCDTFPAKRRLQRSWEDANEVFMSCLQDTVPSHNSTVPWLLSEFRIEDCEEYQDALITSHSRSQDWAYLRLMETQHGCTGWCAPGQQLWADGTHHDACSVAAASIFSGSVHTSSQQVFVTMLTTTPLAAIVFLFAGPRLRKEGIVW